MKIEKKKNTCASKQALKFVEESDSVEKKYM